MLHTGARSVRDDYAYISDSNGYWRFDRLPEVIADGAHERLHVLTHPEWWQEVAMAPRDRILRCISGRARAAEATYDALLADNGRVNVGRRAWSSTGRQPVRRLEVLGNDLDARCREALVFLVAARATARQVGAAAHDAHDRDEQLRGAPSTSRSEARTIGVTIPSSLCQAPDRVLVVAASRARRSRTRSSTGFHAR